MQENKTAPHYTGETPEMVAAFDAYLKMGEGRSLAKLAKALKKRKATVENWSKRMGWHDRIIEWQEEEAERAKEQMKKEFFNDAANLRDFKSDILHKLKEKFDRAHYCSECEQTRLTVSELRNIWEIIKTELGEPTNITKNTAPNPANDPFALMLSRMFPVPNVEPKAT